MNSKLPLKIGVWAVSTLLSVVWCWQVEAQPQLVSVVPANGATGVSPTAPVVFTFSEPMDPDPTATTVFFTGIIFPPDRSWNQSYTVLTCTPTSPFPSNQDISWYILGTGADGTEMLIPEFGSFRTGSGGGGGSGGSGTNKLTSFVTGIMHYYEQTSTAVPALDPQYGYVFGGTVVLASNRTANAVSLTLPSTGVSDLMQNPFAQEMWFTSDSRTDLTSFNSVYGAGIYQYQVSATSSNQTVSVNMPGTSSQPPVPRISNYAAAQAVLAGQPFELTWDTFTGGTANDHIVVDIPDANFSSPGYGMPGALTGTAKAFTIPANTLQANSNYAAEITFYRPTWTSNASFTTLTYRATITGFTISTAGDTSPPPTISKPGFVGGVFGFDLASSPGLVTVLYSSNLVAGQWYPLTTTNSPGLARIVDPRSTTNRLMFYRAHTGS